MQLTLVSIPGMHPEIRLREVEVHLQEIKRDFGIPGFGIVVSSSNIPIGTITDGDVRRAIATHIGNPSDLTASQIMNPKFDYAILPRGIGISGDVDDSTHRIDFDSKHRYLVIKNFDGTYAGVLDLKKFQNKLKQAQLESINLDNLEIYLFGLGFVGLTLGLVIADCGFTVRSVEPNSQRCKELENPDELDIFEPGIKELLNTHLGTKLLVENALINYGDSETRKLMAPRVYIIAVGSPVIDGIPDLSQVENVSRTIGNDITRGDLVIVRTTLPVGTSKKVILKWINKVSGLQAGIDYFLVFAPERTIEGNALAELRSLPQIIGGLTDACVSYASKLFIKFAPNIIRVSNIETAEMIKLANNSFRDVMFGFSNEISEIAARNGVDSLEMIQAANVGYARSSIQRPSVGVGGACLTKDSYLLLANQTVKFKKQSLVLAARKANELSISRYAERIIRLHGPTNFDKFILIVGTAFKGNPPNRDERYSPSLQLIEYLVERGFQVSTWDPEIISRRDTRLGKTEFVKEIKSVVLMTNHLGNAKFLESFVRNFADVANISYLFDPWEIADWNLLKNHIHNRQTFPCDKN